jgi:hypothetical protein
MMIWPFAFSNVAEERGALSVLVVISTKDRNMHKGFYQNMRANN